MDSNRLTRRNFLKTTGLAAGGLATAPLFATQGASRPANTIRQNLFEAVENVKVGVLLPQSNIYPGLGQSFASGLQFYFDQVEPRPAGRAIQFIPEDTGFGYRLVRSKVAKLTGPDSVKLVVGLVNPVIVAGLHQILQENQALLLASSSGENLPRQEQTSPYVLQHSLMQWQSNWALGRWAAQHIGRRAFMASSLYDSGYDAFYAFRLGFEGAGGEIVDTQVTHNPATTNDLDPAALFDRIAATRPDFVFASYSGPQAVEFVKAYAASGFSGQIPLVGSSFLVDEAILPDMSEAALGIKTVFSWSNRLDNSLNRSFSAAYQAQTGVQANPFAVLGFEAGRLLEEIVKAAAGEKNRVTLSSATLVSNDFTGPRGPLTIDPFTGGFGGPLYLREVQPGQGMPSNAVIDVLEAPTYRDNQLETLRRSLKTGWLHGYLCI
jgi:branched-chain amino acid transport system substrate-binding protein